MDATNVPRIEPGDIENLALKVAEWCREATTEFDPPSSSGCRTVAFYLLVFRDSIQTRSRQGRTATYAKNLRRQLTREDEIVSKAIDEMLSGVPNRKWLSEKQELQVKLREAREAIEHLLPALAPVRDPEQDPIRRLAAVVREAWAETNDERSPESNNADDPTCKFLIKALEGHQNLTPNGISDILRGRRRNR